MKLAMKLLLFLVVVLSLVGSASATDYFVKNGGSDSADGLSDTNAWETVGKVDGFSFSTGDDVYFKCDDTWTEEKLTVNWDGTSSDYVDIGAYYGDGIVGVSGNKPTLDGLNTTPSADYSGIILVYRRDYVNISNLSLKNSRWDGVRLQGESSSVRKEHNNVINVDTETDYKVGIKYIYISEGIVEGCNVTDCARTEIGGGDWPAVVAITTSDNITIRNNNIYKNYGEGIGIYTISHDCILEDNILFANKKVQIYIDHSYSNIVRRNLVYGTDNTTFWRTVDGPGSGIGISDESWMAAYSRNNTVYNNLIANTSTGLFLWSGWPAWPLNDTNIYNNIILDSRVSNIDFSSSRATSENSAIKNNIIAYISGSGTLVTDAVSDAGLTWDNNLWSSAPDTDAQGSNDPTYDNPQLAKTSGWTSLIANELNGSEFVIQSGSYAINNGTDLGSPYDQGLNSTSTWVDNIILADQDDYGTAWEIGAFVYGTAAAGESAPTTSDFTYYKIITINQTMVNQSIGTGIYPMLVSTTDTDLRDHCQADGDDIVFFDADNTTLLPYEQEFWNSTNGELVEWVGVEDIINETHIVMYYNNSTIANSENATGVWDSNFVVVQHLNETPAGTTYDSTSNNNDGTTTGMDSADQVPGQVDGSLDFDGADYISLTSLPIDNNAAFTISTWMHGEPGNITYGEGYSGDGQWALFLGIEDNSPYSARFYYKENNVWKALTTGTTQVNDTWHHVVLSQASKSSRTIYIDGVAEETDTDVVGDMSILDTASIGTLERSTFAGNFTGKIDELRISDIARSAEWTETEYNNTAYPALFISIGSEQGEGAADTKFEYWTGSAWVDDEAQYYLWFTCFWHTAECANAEQSGSQATLKISNNGTASGTPKMKLNESAPAGIRIFVDDDNTFADAVELTNTYQAVSTSLNQDTNITLWAWANLSGAPAWEFETYAIVE